MTDQYEGPKEPPTDSAVGRETAFGRGRRRLVRAGLVVAVVALTAASASSLYLVLQLQPKVDELEEDLDAARSDLAETDGAMTDLARDVGPRLTDLEGELSDVLGQAGQPDRIDQVEGELQALSSIVESLDSSLGLLDSRLGIVTGSVDGVDGRVDCIDSALRFSQTYFIC